MYGSNRNSKHPPQVASKGHQPKYLGSPLSQAGTGGVFGFFFFGAIPRREPPKALAHKKKAFV